MSVTEGPVTAKSTNTGSAPPALIRQYGCGRVEFTGSTPPKSGAPTRARCGEARALPI
jgi:hypothetical protein